MPNTLAHLGVQSLLTRRLISGADVKWIYIGCVIPDVPWIFQRAFWFLKLNFDRYEVFLYSGIQSSLCFCLILSGALALTTKRVNKVFLILAVGSLLHLLLDASQLKWANGVLLWAPFSWKLTSYGLYWPESIVAGVLSLTGLIYVLLMWRSSSARQVLGFTTRRAQVIGALICLIAYVLGPLLFRQPMLDGDNYYLATLKDRDRRPGREIAIDRGRLIVDVDKMLVEMYSGERFTVAGLPGDLKPATISLQGRFTGTDRIEITRYHLHPAGLREIASIVGLSLVCLFWLWVLIESLGRKRGCRNYHPYWASWIRKK